MVQNNSEKILNATCTNFVLFISKLTLNFGLVSLVIQYYNFILQDNLILKLCTFVRNLFCSASAHWERRKEIKNLSTFFKTVLFCSPDLDLHVYPRHRKDNPGCLINRFIFGFASYSVFVKRNQYIYNRVFQNASKSKFQDGGLPKLAIIPN